MFTNLCKTRIGLSFLYVLFISTFAMAQAVQTNNNDDQNDEEDFIVVGTPGLKPDTGHVHPLCARPDEGPFSLWIEVRLANMDDIDLSCPFVVKATISIQGQEEPSLDIYSNPLNFSCAEEGFCEACPNIPLCRSYAIFNVPPASFYSLCSGSYGEKVEINISASLSYGCEEQGQMNYYSLMDLETPGCNGYLPSACFNVNTSGSVRGEGCLICPELREESPDTIKVTSGMRKSTEQKEHYTQLDKPIDYRFFNSSNLIWNELVLFWEGKYSFSENNWTVVTAQGQVITQGVDDNGEIRFKTHNLNPGVYFLHITSNGQSITFPWVKM